MKVLVLGDPILDVFVEGTHRENPEGTTLAIVEGPRHEFHGGAANLVRNLRTMGAFVDCMFPDVDDWPVVTRYLSGTLEKGNTLLRVDSPTPGPLTRYHRSEFSLETLWDRLRTMDAVVISDYARGLVTRSRVDLVMGSGRPVYVDPHPKGLPLEAYKGARMVKVNEAEARAMTGSGLGGLRIRSAGPVSDSDDEHTHLAMAVRSQAGAAAAVVTQGSLGMSSDAGWRVRSCGEGCHPAGCGDTAMAALVVADLKGLSPSDLRVADRLAREAAHTPGIAAVPWPTEEDPK
jgi:bifunctional ADP-heptose synthase (sugar kinase/adenylyltransferase)